MIRFLILIGYTILMMFLQVSGRLNQYINVHYRYLAIISMALSFILAIVQLILWNKEEDKESTEHHHHDEHDHGLDKPYQRGIAYLLLALPLMVGFLFPTVSLDTSIVEAKGFNFPLSKESVGDPDVETQYLKPDTSIYFDKTDYDKQMKQALSHYIKDDHVKVTEENYLEVMELIYNYPSEFIGKTITYKGFAFNAAQKEQSDLFVFRFGIIHCVADSGVFGLLTKMPDGQTFENNEWLELTGTIHSGYYAPFKREIPMVDVTKVTSIEEPKNQYVYRSF
ncbi:TIGR03943 family protein [Enterococcus ureilyticus]|uniref:TIGR03943 family protein n=1 Tax=Enterococcus ureilyticus TaxID=1131292 RepID=A0A1E5HFY4_9ENTE|nr:TIGR03943 family protein [Enterococcus ureilyticus]MBM7688076.1 putative membrane protein [Enterococcus ureilyticus]MBO0446856.1 TIGR03943 family protein [Enterococcus ureilyticus]OEG23858.1 TIGR03943 family protein [Enterococcus ureilyticus]